MSTLQQLHEIPDLALEAVMTIDHPHRDTTTGDHKPTKAASHPAPTNLHALVALWAPTDADIDRGNPTGSLLLELLTAVRVVVEEFADDRPQWADPLPDWPEHTWTAVCAWLRLCAPLWASDAFTEEWVGDAVRKAYTGLRALVRAPRELRMSCTVPGCIDRARLQPGDQWALCDAGHQIDIEAARWDFLDSQQWTLSETRDAIRTWLGIQLPTNTLKTWIKRGWLRPVDDNTWPRRYAFKAARELVTDKRSA